YRNVPMQTARVVKVEDETEKVKTLELGCRLIDATPGQFLMVWVPEVGERPISIANNDPLTLTVANVGKVSGALHRLKKDDLVSFRGPLGSGFVEPQGNEREGRILLIGGGYGVAPLYFLAKMATKVELAVDVVIGARTGKDLLFEKKLYAVSTEVFVTTDDGSRGKKGNVMEEVKWLLKDRKFDMVYACGPERMMRAVAQYCKEKEVPCQVSLERYMKCGTGVCGSCDLDGKTVCRDGPVFSGNEALNFSEFGEKKRDASGQLVDL
ncbi:MAG TPA: dihydroorotate dehydrogenase electron transfer subunit, partial [Chromatiaceae bacterium]|nr:dihydroorotate dehydrogenase electron transfer subunit [Chromatiaceae bacterium]